MICAVWFLSSQTKRTQTCRSAGVNFSVTLQSNTKLQAAIAGIGEGGWRAVRYPGAVYDEQLGQWISNAEVAETLEMNESTSSSRYLRALKRLRDELSQYPSLFGS